MRSLLKGKNKYSTLYNLFFLLPGETELGIERLYPRKANELEEHSPGTTESCNERYTYNDEDEACRNRCHHTKRAKDDESPSDNASDDIVGIHKFINYGFFFGFMKEIFDLIGEEFTRHNIKNNKGKIKSGNKIPLVREVFYTESNYSILYSLNHLDLHP